LKAVEATEEDVDLAIDVRELAAADMLVLCLHCSMHVYEHIFSQMRGNYKYKKHKLKI